MTRIPRIPQWPEITRGAVTIVPYLLVVQECRGLLLHHSIADDEIMDRYDVGICSTMKRQKKLRKS